MLVLGLEAGVSAGAALAAPTVEALAVVEPDAGVVAAHRDPGDLFGAANGRPLADPRLSLVQAPAWPRLRAGGAWDVVLTGGDPAPRTVALARAATGGLVVVRLDPGPAGPDGQEAWDLRARLAALLPALGPDVLAFWPRRGAPLVLVAGAGRLSPERVARRLRAAPVAGERLAALGLRRPADVVGLCVAGPVGLSAFVLGGQGDDPVALALRAAESLPETLALPDDAPERAGLLALLAEEAGRRRAPTALPLARAALRAARTPETLRVVGDALLLEGRRDEALARWREALALDPASVAPKLSIAAMHQQEQRPEEARRLLEDALEGDPARDAPLRYALGQLAMGRGDHAAAREAFLAAGELGDAAERAALAGELLRRDARPERRLGAEQRLAAARLQLERAELERDEAAAERLRGDALAGLLELADRPDELPDAGRAELGRLLARAAGAEPLAPVRAHLYRRAADVLQPLDGEPALAVERAVALHLGGRTDEAEALLSRTAGGAGARVPQVHAALGDLLAATGRREAAIAAYEQALAVGPGSSADATIYLSLAGLHRQLGRLDRATRALEAADRAAPGHPEVLANLGTIYREQGRDGDALAAWRRFLEVAPPRHPLRARVEAAVRRLEERR
ncbi:MAG: tetratricopeptide repeat protein [Planctomycetes bacterium]|nr:tetratricopeptide repeat protein [Planctomycetota bacterium]